MLRKLDNFILESTIVKEGGNAVPDVDRIEQKYVMPTVYEFCSQILDNFTKQDSTKYAFLLGSTGKNPDSGDIDIGIANDRLPEETTLKNLIRIKNFCQSKDIYAVVNSFSWDMIHISFPQYDEHREKTGKNVQVDMIVTEHPAMLKWYMTSPSKAQSKYKSAHRNILINAILRARTLKALLTADSGELVKWQTQLVNQDGLMENIQILVDKNGKKLKYKDTDEDLLPQYAMTERSTLVTTDPKEAMDKIFGKGFDQSALLSFETLYKWIDENCEDKEQIFKEACYLLTGQEKRLIMPEELKPYAA